MSTSQLPSPLVRDHQRTLVRLLSEFTNPAAVEVGVAAGNTSEYLLRNCPTLHLAMVDQWKCPEGHPQTERVQKRMDEARTALPSRLSFADGRYRILHMPSLDAAKRAPDEAFDLVFIDAHHGHASVLSDNAGWWPTVKRGGYLCGHDIDGKKDLCGVWGVRNAVEQFSRLIGLPFECDKNVWIMRKS